MVLNFQIESRPNKSKSMLVKTVTIDNDGKNISYKTIKQFYNTLLSEGYSKNSIYVKVLNPQRYFTVSARGNEFKSLKGLQNEFEDTLEDYYRNKVVDPTKFTNEFSKVIFGIIDE